MMPPSWLQDSFAAVMLLVAGLSAARLALAGRAGRAGVLAADSDTDAAHLLMAIAMVGMLASGLHTLPSAVWEVIFAALTVWFAVRVAVEARGRTWRAYASSCHLPHLVHSVAMLYMFLALRGFAAHAAPASAMAGMSGGSASSGLRLPTLALLLALALAGFAVRDLDRLTDPTGGLRPRALAVPRPRPAVAPALAAGGPALMTAAGPTVTTPAPASGGSAPAVTAPARSRLDAVLAPRLAVGARIAMGVTMAYMLIIMI